MFNIHNNAKGFTLPECMASLLVIVVCLTYLGPILGRVYAERVSIIQTETALSLLNNQLHQWSTGSASLPVDTNEHHTHYQLEWHPIDANTVQLCIIWESESERDHKLCGSAKR